MKRNISQSSYKQIKTRMPRWILPRNHHLLCLIGIRFKRNPLIDLVRTLCVYEAIIWIGTLQHLTNTLKIVENDYIYKVASLKSLILLDKLELLYSFFSKDLAEVYVIAYNSLKFITHRYGYFYIFAVKQVSLIDRVMQSFVTRQVYSIKRRINN